MPADDALRKVGTFTAACVLVANAVGSGIFTTTGFQARDLGDPGLILLLWAVGGGLALAACGLPYLLAPGSDAVAGLTLCAGAVALAPYGLWVLHRVRAEIRRAGVDPGVIGASVVSTTATAAPHHGERGHGRREDEDGERGGKRRVHAARHSTITVTAPR